MYNFCYLYFLIVELVPYLSFKNITSIGMIHETVIIVSADTGILQRLIVLLLKAVAFLCYVFLATATFGMLRLAIKLLKPFYRGKCKSHPRKQFYSRSAI